MDRIAVQAILGELFMDAGRLAFQIADNRPRRSMET
jgi:hypothetical protein